MFEERNGTVENSVFVWLRIRIFCCTPPIGLRVKMTAGNSDLNTYFSIVEKLNKSPDSVMQFWAEETMKFNGQRRRTRVQNEKQIARDVQLSQPTWIHEAIYLHYRRKKIHLIC